MSKLHWSLSITIGLREKESEYNWPPFARTINDPRSEQSVRGAVASDVNVGCHRARCSCRTGLVGFDSSTIVRQGCTIAK